MTIQIGTILVASLVVVTATVVTTRATHGRSDASARQSNAATIVADLRVKTQALQSYVSMLENAAAGQAVELTPALDAHDKMQSVVLGTQQVLLLRKDTDTTEIHNEAVLAQAALERFFVSQRPLGLREAFNALTQLDRLAAPAQQKFAKVAQDDQASLKSATTSAQEVIIVAVVLSTIAVIALSLLVGKRMTRLLAHTMTERDRLEELTHSIEKRNDQFNALYQVVNEVTDNLSMRYVVKTTVGEAAKLVGASFVELRLLRDDALTLAGRSGFDEPREGDDTTLPLGVGLAGRVAKRGKTLRIDSGAGAAMAEEERVAGVESALIVPLIVGARVLGTLACWSLTPDDFDADDERILELMAAQVASAVAAADVHESDERKAMIDVLTALPNRRQMIEDTDRLQRALAAGSQMAVVMLDIDHFKRFNDDFGHRVGDVTLQKVAEVLKHSVRETDHIYRYGGEEFVIVFSAVDEVQAIKLTERVRVAVEKTPLTGESLEPVGPVTISAGIALAPHHSKELAELLRIADEAMYISKNQGRNQLTVAPSTVLVEAA